jgi:precorrin-2/cobalt-factor-2 C20-methyltransferase
VAGDGRAGRLFGVGVGPGDPELLTMKAARVLGECGTVAHFAARRRHGNAWTTVQALLRPDQIVLRLEFPLTTEPADRDEYERCIAEFYDRAAEDVAAHLDGGTDVAVVCEGDPFFYGSYMHLHHRLCGRYDTEVVPGITSLSSACAAAGTPLVSMRETLTVLPGVLPPGDLAEMLARVDAAVVMKVGRHLDEIREALTAAGRAGEAIYVERASCGDERVLPLAETDGVDAPYFSLVLVPGRELGRRAERRAGR